MNDINIEGENLETILFENYQKYQKEHRDNLFRALFKLPLIAIIMLITLMISTVLGITSTFVKEISFIFPYTILVEAVLCVVIYFYTDHFRIENSVRRLTKYANYCGEIAKWLKSTGFVFNQANVEQLIKRLSAKLDKIENERLRRKEAIEKWIQILIIPVLLAVFSQSIQKQENVAVLLYFAVVVLTFVGLIGISILSINSIIEFFRKRKIEQLRGFVDDLQGILDTQFTNRLFDVDNNP